MFLPPSSSDLLGSTFFNPSNIATSYLHSSTDIDPTKLKARQFARSAAPAKNVDNSLWTEMPAERQQRIADEVSGKKRRAANDPEKEPDANAIERTRTDEEIRRSIAKHTASFTQFPTLPDNKLHVSNYFSARHIAKQKRGRKRKIKKGRSSRGSWIVIVIWRLLGDL